MDEEIKKEERAELNLTPTLPLLRRFSDKRIVDLRG